MAELPAVGTAILLVHNEQIWRTQLMSINEDGLLLDVGELVPEGLHGIDPGTRVQCRYHESQALASFECELLGLEKNELGLELMRLAMPVHVSHRQRRKHLRVSMRLPVKLQVLLRNEKLSRSLGREMTMNCWIQGTAVNISAGGFRVQMVLPRYHALSIHREAIIRFELEKKLFKDRRLAFVRRDWSTDEPIAVYRFTDLEKDEIEWLEKSNNNWLHDSQQLGSGGNGIDSP